MLIIKVWRLPALGAKELEELCKHLLAAAVSIRGLGIRQTEVACLFPKDAEAHGIPCDILLELTFADVPEWKDTLGTRLENKLVSVLKDAFPKARIKCFAYSAAGTLEHV